MSRTVARRKRFEPAAASADDVLRHYLNDVGRYALLTRAQELELTRAARSGDADAMERLVKANLRFVISFAKRYQHHGVSLHDLIQEGNIGLMLAAETFDPERGFRFLTHARHWVRAQMTRAIEKTGRTVRLPASQLRKLSAMRNAQAELERELGRPPRDVEVADRAGFSVAALGRIRRLDQPVLSMDAPVAAGDDEASDLHRLLAHDGADPGANVEQARRAKLLRQAIGELEERRQRVLALYFGLADEQPLTLEEIGSVMGVTRERIRQLRNDAVGRLRVRLETMDT